MQTYFYNTGKHQSKLNKHIQQVSNNKNRYLEYELLKASLAIYNHYHTYQHLDDSVISEYNFINIHNKKHKIHLDYELQILNKHIISINKNSNIHIVLENMISKLLTYIDKQSSFILNNFDSSKDFK